MTITLTAGAILFDLDGVLADSREDVVRNWKLFAGWYGLDGEELVTRIHGFRCTDTIERELAHLPAEEIEQAKKRYIEHEISVADGAREVPGAANLLKQVTPDKWAVVTSCTLRLAHARLAAIGILPPRNLVPADQVEHGKPHPEGYLTGAAILNADPARCVVFEDAPSGIQAAIAAGCTPVGVATTVPVDELRDALPKSGIVIADLEAVDVSDDGEQLTISLQPL